MITLIDKILNLYWELRLGINTRGIAGIDSADDEHIHYGTVPYRTINTILNYLKMNRDDVFVDLGCGKGRVVCCASMRGIHHSIGIECSSALSAIAKHNASVLRKDHSIIDILMMDAQSFDYSTGTVFYLFHPFGPNTLRVVLNKLKTGLDASPRSIKIVYLNPVFKDVVSEYPWLIEFDYWKPRYDRSPEHHVIWWKNITVS